MIAAEPNGKISFAWHPRGLHLRNHHAGLSELTDRRWAMPQGLKPIA